MNVFPSLVHTARQATRAGSTRSRCPNLKGNDEEGGAEGKTSDWD